MPASPHLSLPVAVILGRKTVSRGAWSVPSWRAVSVLAGENLVSAGAQGALIMDVEGEEHFLWSGLRLELFRDGAHSYWSNLVGQQPSLFVICHDHEDTGLRPMLVTADQDQASAAIEASGAVYRVPIPPEVYVQLERFVVEHYKPTPPRKRRRKNWSP
jgi:hypothetical protein